MKLDENMMKKVLKEEYDKRINYFLMEKISVKDKRGVNVLQYASGLKVLDNAGNQYTFGGIVKKGNEEFFKLYLPDEPREEAFGSSSEAPLYEEDRNEIGFMSSVRDGVKQISPLEDKYGEEIVDEPESDMSRKPKLPDRKYILVPAGEFEERFKLKTEEE
jgi:hypothetical protein